MRAGQHVRIANQHGPLAFAPVIFLACLCLMLWKNKMPLISTGLEESPVLAATPGAVVRKNLEDVTTGETQRKAADCINDNCLNLRW